MMQQYLQKVSLQTLQYGIFLQSLLAMVGSLFFSDILHYPPCTLCWYQRICMYPIVLLSAVAIMRKDAKFYTYVLPLSVIGILISIYHNLLYWKLLPESGTLCGLQFSCTIHYVSYFGFLTIPLMSFLAFLVVNVLAYVSWIKFR